MKGNYFLCLLLLMTSYNSFAQEICDNAKDDDGDGLVDLYDPDCQCHYQVSGNLLLNASFESFKHCPSDYSYDNDSRIVDYWPYGTYTNVNEASYYHNLNCSYDSSQVMLYIPPSLPLPDGTAFMGIRQYIPRKPDLHEKDIAKVYISQCLQTPLKPGEEYTLSFSAGRFKSNDDRNYKHKSEPFTVAVFGHPDCNAVPFGQPRAESNGCPTNYPGWILLGETKVYSEGKWVQSKINFIVPPGINVIEIGPDCSILNPDIDLTDSTTFLDFYVYYLDDLHLLTTKDFHFLNIQNQNGNSCIPDSVLQAPEISNASYQWYKDSIAITGATENRYHIFANNSIGNYNVRIITGDSCLISEPFSVGLSEFSKINLPADTSFCETDTLLLAPSLNGVTYNSNGSSSPMVKVFQEGIYEITATNANGCTKKFNVNVSAQNCNIYMPNAFTPNGDGKNDVFRIPRGAITEVQEFTIFDMWGNKVFSTINRSTGWDGNFKGKGSSAGTYVYIIKGMVNNKKKQIKGTVTLIR
jgi:gliding motility-associated-like protein